jgi:hypothetical protein
VDEIAGPRFVAPNASKRFDPVFLLPFDDRFSQIKIRQANINRTFPSKPSKNR